MKLSSCYRQNYVSGNSSTCSYDFTVIVFVVINSQLSFVDRPLSKRGGFMYTFTMLVDRYQRNAFKGHLKLASLSGIPFH